MSTTPSKMATAKLASTSASTVLQAFVRNVKGESEIVISFQFNGKNHHMHRPKSQALSQTIQRLSLTVAKSLGVKSEKKKRYKTKDADLSPVPPVSFLSNNKEAVPLNSLNGEAWKDHSLLVIGNTMYSVTVNNPRVIKLHLQELVFEGCPIVPQVKLIIYFYIICFYFSLSLSFPILPSFPPSFPSFSPSLSRFL